MTKNMKIFPKQKETTDSGDPFDGYTTVSFLHIYHKNTWQMAQGKGNGVRTLTRSEYDLYPTFFITTLFVTLCLVGEL